MMLYQLEYVLRSKGKKGGAKLCFAPDDFYATTLNPGNPSACGCGWGDAACAEPWLRSDEYARGSHGTLCRLLPACGYGHRPGRSAVGALCVRGRSSSQAHLPPAL